MFMPTTIRPRRLAASLALVALVGCSDTSLTKDTLPRQAVSGTVTLDGQPLARGKIQFDPVKGEQAPAAFSVGEIKDGKYAIDRAMGPVPGQYKVSISSRPSITIDAGQEPGERPKQEAEKVPAQYNSKSTITKEVTAAGGELRLRPEGELNLDPGPDDRGPAAYFAARASSRIASCRWGPAGFPLAS